MLMRDERSWSVWALLLVDTTRRDVLWLKYDGHYYDLYGSLSHNFGYFKPTPWYYNNLDQTGKDINIDEWAFFERMNQLELLLVMVNPTDSLQFQSPLLIKKTQSYKPRVTHM